MKRFFLLTVCFLSVILVNAQTVNKVKLDSLFSLLDEKQQTMGTILILKEGNSIYSNSIGYSSIEKNIKAGSNTRYRIGSVTKVFTATLLFQLLDEGKISLETPLAHYFPQIPNAEKISIANLLNHSSGLFNITNSKAFNPYEAKSHNQMLASIAEFEPVFEPGTRAEYSNTNYILLGYILEQVEGDSYAAILKKRITNKLNLKGTYYGGRIKTENKEAQSYYFKESWELSQATDLSLPHGAGAVVSTSKDMATFIYALFNKQLISEKSFAKMISQKNNTGFGISLINENGKILYGHNGAIDGFSSLLIYEPEDKLAIAFAANGNRYPDLSIVRHALMAAYDKPFEMPAFDEIEVNAEELEKYTGIYASPDAPMTLTFICRDGKLYGAPTGQEPAELKATKEHQFKLEQAGITLDFLPEEGGLNFSQGGNSLLFKKQK